MTIGAIVYFAVPFIVPYKLIILVNLPWPNVQLFAKYSNQNKMPSIYEKHLNLVTKKYRMLLQDDLLPVNTIPGCKICPYIFDILSNCLYSYIVFFPYWKILYYSLFQFVLAKGV